MIQFLADGIDQLDLALDQLAVRDRNFDRFALMLVDNVVELTLHQYARDRASENELWARLREPKYDPKAVENALGHNFDRKVKLAVLAGAIDSTMQASLLCLHSFRNTAYHQGLRHEPILHSLTLFYFRCACQILRGYKPRYWAWSSADTYSHRARKYLGEPGLDAQGRFEAAYERLEEVAASMESDLKGDLAKDMSQTIDSIDEAIDFVATDSPESLTRDGVVVNAQLWQIAFRDDIKTFARENGFEGATVQDYVYWLRDNYPWELSSDPIPSWRSRLQSLEGEGDEHVALKKYCDFMTQTARIRDALEESAVQLDMHIQQEIDRLRGK